MATIQGIYLALFGRPADPAGLAFFNEATGNGADLTAIGDLAATEEYQSRFEGMTDGQIINSIYQSLFGRGAEPAGLEFFTSELAAGHLTINNIAIAILDGAQGNDLAVINAKIAAANLFTSHLDLQTEISAYSGDDAAAVGRDYIAGITPDHPGTGENADAAILKLFPDEGQEPGEEPGGGGVTPPTEAVSGKAVDLYDTNGKLVGGFDTIQDAVDNAQDHYRVAVNAGTYNENVTVDVTGLTIAGRGGVVLEGTFKADNGLADDGSVSTFLQTAISYVATAGSGITVAADDVIIKNIAIESFARGIEITDVSGVGIAQVTIEDTIFGITNSSAAYVTSDASDITITSSKILDSYEGINFSRSGAASGGFINGLNITGVTFQDLTDKGIYLESVSNAAILNTIMNNVGQFGRGDAFGNIGEFGNGIDINLKYGDYSNIVVDGFTFTDVGLSNGAGSSHAGGAAITIKARDDGSYSSSPATVNVVEIKNGTIDGTSVGIRAGEPGKSNVGPELNITGVLVTHAAADADNVSGSTYDVTLTDGGDYFFVAATSTGHFNIVDGLGHDQIYAGKASDTIYSNAGDDVIAGRGGNDEIHLGNGVKTLIFESSANNNGLDTVYGLNGDDRLDFSAFVGPVSNSDVHYVPATGNSSVTDNSVIIVDFGQAIANYDFGGANFGNLFSLGGPLSTVTANNTQSVIIVQGTDQTQVYYANSGNAFLTGSVISADEVKLVGILDSVTNATSLHVTNDIVPV